MKLRRIFRKGYLFAYGTGQEIDMVTAVTGEVPKIIGHAVLPNYELRIQKLAEIPTTRGNPRQLLQKTWGNSFKSYALVSRKGAQASGVVFELSLRARNKFDDWELVKMGWYKRRFVIVELEGPVGRCVLRHKY
jgi:hypothetical protein